jgi:hypothetical protein
LGGSGSDGLVELTRLSPRACPCGGDAIPSFSNGLIADDDRLVPSVDEAVALETCHELIERCSGATNTILGDDVTNHSTGLLVGEDDAEREELEMR